MTNSVELKISRWRLMYDFPMHRSDAPSPVRQHGTPESVHFGSMVGEESELRAACLVIWLTENRVCT
jgi:hypothetical protein